VRWRSSRARLPRGTLTLHLIILDATQDISRRTADAIPSGTKTTAVRTVAAVTSLLSAAGHDDVLLVHLAGDVHGAPVAAALRQSGFRGRVVAVADRLQRADAEHLLQIPQLECVETRGAPAALPGALKRAMVDSNSVRYRRPRELPSFHGIVGRSKQIQDIFTRIEKAAAGDANVCIYGESGTGKELIARAIHAASDRRDRPLVTLDCTAVPEGLMESQLFGHVKGAFTGAVEHREGVFSLADTGTLFIDELCELSLTLQAKLLRVVQSREFVKVGGTKPIRSNIRLITATNKDPKKGVDAGTFRADLYYRVAVVMIKVPPLRDRRDDIPLLVDHFLERFATAYKKPVRGVEPSAMERIVGMPWPGNIRQLENFLAQAVVLAEGDTLAERDLFVDDVGAAPIASTNLQLEPGLQLREVERRYILRTLQRVQGNRTEAARLLGISVRCLQYKLKAYSQTGEEFEPPRSVVAPRPAPRPEILAS
jgi:DNA-binding NtrC family response regulator